MIYNYVIHTSWNPNTNLSLEALAKWEIWSVNFQRLSSWFWQYPSYSFSRFSKLQSHITPFFVLQFFCCLTTRFIVYVLCHMCITTIYYIGSYSLHMQDWRRIYIWFVSHVGEVIMWLCLTLLFTFPSPFIFILNLDVDMCFCMPLS